MQGVRADALLTGDHNDDALASKQKANLMNLTRINLTQRTRTALKISLAASACVAFSACGAVAEKITEEGAERIIEAETGGDVELDFDSGDGSFSIETEDGSLEVDEDGNFVVTDEDGSVFTGSANDDGITVTDGDGEQVLSIDEDNGEMTIAGEDSDDVFRLLTDVPEEWPSDLPQPGGLTVESGSYIASNGETLMTVVGTPANQASDYVDDYVAALAAAGLSETGTFNSSNDGAVTSNHSYENAEWTVNITGFSDDTTNSVSISIVSKPS